MYKKQNMFLKNLPPDNIPRNNAFYAMKNPLFLFPQIRIYLEEDLSHIAMAGRWSQIIVSTIRWRGKTNHQGYSNMTPWLGPKDFSIDLLMSVSWIFLWVWNTTLTFFGIPVAASRDSMVTSSFPKFTATRYPGNPSAFLVYIRRSPSLNTLISPHWKDSLLLNSWSLMYTFRVVKLSSEESSDCKCTNQSVNIKLGFIIVLKISKMCL